MRSFATQTSRQSYLEGTSYLEETSYLPGLRLNHGNVPMLLNVKSFAVATTDSCTDTVPIITNKGLIHS
jgi:hypothetical protein